MTNKVKEIQRFLAEKGIKASEVAIVNTAIDIIQKSTKGYEAFVEELKEKNRLKQQKHLKINQHDT